VRNQHQADRQHPDSYDRKKPEEAADDAENAQGQPCAAPRRVTRPADGSAQADLLFQPIERAIEQVAGVIVTIVYHTEQGLQALRSSDLSAPDLLGIERDLFVYHAYDANNNTKGRNPCNSPRSTSSSSSCTPSACSRWRNGSRATVPGSVRIRPSTSSPRRITLVIVGKWFLPIFLENKIYTMPQFLEQRYGTRIRTLMAVFWLALYIFVNLTSIVWLGSIAVTKVAGIDQSTALVALGLFALLHQLWGGLRAVAMTDIVQSRCSCSAA